MKVALVHDDLVQLGGAERVLEGLCEIFPDAPIYTTVFDKGNFELGSRFGSKDIKTSFLQKIPGWKILYKVLFFLHPLAFEQFDFSQFDLVISQTTRFAKSVITKPKTIHICYCHTPPRFLWRFSGQKSFGLGEVLMTKLRLYDQISSKRVDFFIAGSKNAKERIKKVYKADSKVVYPFIDLERFKSIKTVENDYFVAIGRLNKYKRFDLVIKACQKLSVPLKVVGNGPELDKLKSLKSKKIEFLTDINDQQVVSILAGCKALIVAGVEDFGLTPLEAQALGKPVVFFGSGGTLETVIDKKTGILFNEQTEDSLAQAIIKLNGFKINPDDCIKNANRFGKDIFIKNFKQTIAKML